MINKFHELKHKITIKPGLIDLLKKLNGYKIALATGAMQETADENLKRFNITNYFDFVIGGDQVKEAKPNPEIFLKAAEYFNVKATECVVVEDAILGMEAAKSCGMKVIALEDEFTKYQDHSIADAKIEKLSELPKILEVENG
jgi:beta-phosphoglucomutase